jgi:thioredoxin reductase (NADPH)
MGEIAFLDGGNWSMLLRTAQPTRVIEVDRQTMLGLMAHIPEMSDIIITVFAARRRRQLDTRDGALILIGQDRDRAIRRIADFASRNRIPSPRSCPAVTKRSWRHAAVRAPQRSRW